jgi:hypothetical protein
MRIRTVLLLAGAGYAGYRLALKPWRDSWGVDPVEAGAALAGDDLVLAPDHVETRGIDIAAPPEAVWPWLAQMGYGRAGWYSYDRIDMEGGSADAIHPELGALAVGDIVPTHPSGGLAVREVDPGHTLVLYIDDTMVQAQAKAAKATAAAATPANLQASGAFMSAGMGSRFTASWAFVLEPRGSGSRLVERFRIAMEGGGSAGRVAGPAVGFGVFLMMRKQLLGIRDRVEAAGSAPPAEAPASPAADSTAASAEEPLVASPA